MYGGEKMRLRLAQLMYENINLLILDEPTNHLDIESREVLEDTIQHFDGTVIAISHDRYFLNQLFNRIAWLEDQKLFLYEGNFQWAKQKHSEREIPIAIEEPKEHNRKVSPSNNKSNNLNKKLNIKSNNIVQTNNLNYKTELENLEQKLDDLSLLWISE